MQRHPKGGSVGGVQGRSQTGERSEISAQKYYNFDPVKVEKENCVSVPRQVEKEECRQVSESISRMFRQENCKIAFEFQREEFISPLCS